MGLLGCLLGNRPSKWLTNPEKLLIFMRFFLLILAYVQNQKKEFWCNFYEDMYSFVNLANEYLSNYEELADTEKRSYQRRLHEILKRMCHNHTYVIGGTWGESWTLPHLYAFYQVVIAKVKQNLYPGVIGIGTRYDLPEFSYSQSGDPLIRQEIERELFGVLFNLPGEMCQAFPVIFKTESPSQPLNVPPPVVSKPFVDPSSWTHLGAALNLATPREYERSPPTCNDHTPVEVISTPCALCTPRTPRLPGFSKWLLQELLSQEFLKFLKQQSEKSSSDQLKQMFRGLLMFFTHYRVELLHCHNQNTIYSFFQALGAYPVVKIALELYHGKPLDDWSGIDIRIVSESNEENQKRFYEYLKMMIHLKVWLCDDSEKEEFSAKCDGKLWVFNDETNSFEVHDLPEPAKFPEQLRAA